MNKRRIDVLIKTGIIWLILWFVLFYTHLSVETKTVPISVNTIIFIKNPMNYIWGFISFIIIYIFSYIIIKYFEIIGEFIYKYRYLIALGILILGVLLEINGSSIGMWANYIGGHENDIVLSGTSRALRSDEWATSTALGFSQYFQQPAFPYFSEAVRGSVTDMFIVYGQPVRDVAIIFRPAHWGYLFLGNAKGLSFYWIFRNLFLFLTMFELGMILTKKNRALSLLLTVLITFSPVIQWWFAVNNIVEIFAIGSLAVIITYYYILERNYIRKFLYILCLAWCGVSYILTFYPAWQVTMGYVFLFLVLYFILDNRESIQWSWKKDALIILLFVIALVIPLGYIFLKSKDTLQIVMNTVYPGRRIDVGGAWGHVLLDYPFSIFYTITGLTWERGMDVFYDFFPISSLLAIFVWWKTRDRFLGLFLILNTFFFIYITFGFPTLIAKLTLMSYTTGPRAVMAFGTVNILLLVRSLAIYSIKVKKPILISGVLSLILVGISAKLHYDYITEIKALFFSKAPNIITYSVVLAVILIAMLCIYRAIYLMVTAKYNLLTRHMVLLAMFFGMLVNPIRVGVDVIYKNELVNAIKQVNDEQSGKWIVEGLGYPYPNLPLFVGVPTINSTNVYPDLQKWQLLDSDKKYEEVYNRYAHISIDIEDVDEAEFNLLNPDVFNVKLGIEHIKVLQTLYILSTKDLDLKYDDIRCIKTVGNFKIFKLD